MQLRSAAVLSLLLLGSACGVDRVVHDEAAADGEESGGVQVRGGNFPEPAQTVCGALPDGVAPLDRLATAHAVTGPRSAAFGPSDALRIRLASFGVEPGGSLADPTAWTCEEGPRWAVAFDLPLAYATVGVHELADMAPAYPEHYKGTTSLDPDNAGCSGGEAEGEAGGGPEDGSVLHDAGELEIFSITEACVVGELRNVEYGNYPSSGGFVAIRSAAECVPIAESDCD